MAIIKAVTCTKNRAYYLFECVDLLLTLDTIDILFIIFTDRRIRTKNIKCHSHDPCTVNTRKVIS